MLKNRILTATLFITVILCSLFYFETFAFVCTLVFLIALYEWTSLAGFSTKKGKTLCFLSTLLLPLLCAAIFKLLPPSFNEVTGEGNLIFYILISILLSPLLFWVLATLAVIFYPRGLKFYTSPMAGPFVGAWLLFPPLITLISLWRYGVYWVVYPLALVWVADIAAYFAGKAFGRHLLHPKISPKKTWEGVFAAIVAAIVMSVIGYYLLQPMVFKPRLSIILWGLMNVIVVLFSIIGDLFESIFKRVRHLKDSGSILPGHGGMLDRIDSLTAALPLFVIFWQFL